VQCFLGACCLLTLIYKKAKEGAHRSMKSFLFDSSKQLIGAAWLHILNLFFAIRLRSVIDQGDQCEWYWINIMVDTTLGVVIEYYLLQILTAYLSKSYNPDDWKTGDYNDASGVRMDRYFKQLILWLVICSGMKACMVVLMVTASPVLLFVASVVLAPFLGNAFLKLIIVMILTPCVMNAFQLWMVDNFIKKQDSDLVDEDLDGRFRGNQDELSEVIE
jgi:hypothetical protein